ncbi:MFS transporter [Ktedonosporobacter rubrisoli]|uniref:MFS transporter n=1 Tax=Ktedonosporobacter rubrisoli TaxID=2509675 RepID=UPI0013EED49A|nr:MFS transporter [Ktedonosporobacter rubrisoli]
MATSTKILRHRTLLLSSFFHFTNDACFAILSPLLPLIVLELHLSYLQAGILKTLMLSSSGLLQVPISLLGERFGEFLLLAIGNIWVGLGMIGMALAPEYNLLLLAALLAGIGGNAQHPLAASLVSRSYTAQYRPRAIALLNMAGTVGKLFATLGVALLAMYAGWRAPLLCIGLLTLPTIFVIWHERKTNVTIRKVAIERQSELTGRFRWKIALLIAAGCLDETAQKVAMTFLPFLFANYGLSVETIALLISLMLFGGITGKFVCSWLSERWGIFALIWSTEVVTALTLLAFLGVFIANLPVFTLAPLSLLFGFPLDGTSSLLQASLAAVLSERQRTRWYGIYYTATLMGSSLAVIVYGALADRAGLSIMFAIAALLTAFIPMLIWPLRQSLGHSFRP